MVRLSCPFRCSTPHISFSYSHTSSQDSIYTERYMDLPAINPDGYVTASISNVSAFNDVDFLLAHGSGDDNVHFANSAHLLDMFTQAEVRGFKFRMFTDRSVHLILDNFFFLSFFLNHSLFEF